MVLGAEIYQLLAGPERNQLTMYTPATAAQKWRACDSWWNRKIVTQLPVTQQLANQQPDYCGVTSNAGGMDTAARIPRNALFSSGVVQESQ